MSHNEMKEPELNQNELKHIEMRQQEVNRNEAILVQELLQQQQANQKMAAAYEVDRQRSAKQLQEYRQEVHELEVQQGKSVDF